MGRNWREGKGRKISSIRVLCDGSGGHGWDSVRIEGGNDWLEVPRDMKRHK